jgi:hypothetical protein
VNVGSGVTAKQGSFKEFENTLKKNKGRHLMVAAAGNQGRLLQSQKSCPSFFFLPAQLKLSNMLVVGASGECVVGGDRGVVGVFSVFLWSAVFAVWLSTHFPLGLGNLVLGRRGGAAALGALMPSTCVTHTPTAMLGARVR